MSLADTKHDFQKMASHLERRYETYDINDLANNYCKALDEKDSLNTNVYLSALMLRFWSKIDKMYQQVKTADVTREELVDYLYDCINNACQYRAWQDPEKHTNAQACINQSIATRGIAAIMYNANLNKNTKFYTILDDEVDDDFATTKGELIADPTGEKEVENTLTRNMIQQLLKDNRVIEAIIADNIAFKDVFKHNKTTVSKINDEGEKIKYSQYSSEFWPFKLVQELNSLDEDYLKYFTGNYSVKLEVLQLALDALSKATNQKLYNYINKSKSVIASCLCR